MTYPVLEKSPGQIETVNLRVFHDELEHKEIELTREDIEEFIPLLQEGIRELAFEEMRVVRGYRERQGVVFADIQDREERQWRSYVIKESYRELHSWLREQGYIDI